VPSGTDIIDELATWVAANTSFTKGTDLFPHHRHQGTPDRCVVLTNNGGGKEFNSDSARKRFEYMLQVVSRAVANGDAHDDIWLIHGFLFEGPRGAVSLPTGTPTFVIDSIAPVGSPAPIGQDEKQRFEYSTNYNLKCSRL
jgi:hypothetical protein